MDKTSTVVKVPATPVVVKKGSSISVLKNSLPKTELLVRCIKLGEVSKDQLIYKSVPGDFLRGEFPGLTLVSRLNVFNKTSSTVGKFVKNGIVIERNSNEIVKVIGQNNYETVFSALCSVISQELRIKALLALLTIAGKSKKAEVSTQTENSYTHSACQTDESSMQYFDKNFRQRRKIKRQQFRPYIVITEDEKKIKRVIVNPKNLMTPKCKISKSHTSTNTVDATETLPELEMNNETETFPELHGIVNEDSNFSDTSIGNISFTSKLSVNLPQLLENPSSLFNNIDHYTEELNTVPLTLLDGSVIMVCAKPMDKFHWATPDILKSLSRVDQGKLMSQQAVIHWKYCLERDEDGYLPIHQAVLSNDIDFLKPQCAALKYKYGSVDVSSTGNITPLQISIYKGGERCTTLLLQSGADPCLQDDEGRSFFHTAAEQSPEHLKIALDHCRTNARAMLMEDEDLWNPVMKSQSDEELAKILLDHICIMCDNQGYTPLMLASKQGNYASVKLLLEASPDTVNRPMPNCGNTALYLAVGAACIEANNSKNQSKVSESFLKTIEILMEGGGDPSLENYSNSSVNVLLTEFNIVDLSVIIANKLTSVKYFDGNSFAASNLNSLMLYKNSDGKVDVTKIKSRKADNDSKDDVNSPSTSHTNKKCPKTTNNNKNEPKSNITNIKINASKENKKNRNISKNSNVEIKEIKAIKFENAVISRDTLPVTDVHGNTTTVSVKPSHFIIVPKVAQSKPYVPKYVKILPKVQKNIGNKSNIKNEVTNIDKGKKNINTTPKVTHVIGGNAARPKKHKKNTDFEQATVKKPRNDAKDKNKLIENLIEVTNEQTFNSDVEVKSELMTTE